MYRAINIKTVSQGITVTVPDYFTLEEVLLVNHLPVTLFQAFIRRKSGEYYPRPLTTQILDIAEEDSIYIQCIRNTDLRQVVPQQKEIVSSSDAIISLHDIRVGPVESCTETIVEMNDEEAQALVQKKVFSFLEKNKITGKIVMGISGGGDSNTLVHSITSYQKEHSESVSVACFTLIFDPIWPESAAARAIELCKKHAVPHQVLRSKEIEELLQMKSSLSDFYAEFSRIHGSHTSHFFATFIIAKVARVICRQQNASYFALGYNREDVLAEMLFSLMNGKKPLSYPIRKFGNLNLIMPLWEIQKIVLDACYPKYSIENYEERMDSTTYQRGLIYYLAHSVDSIFPNLGLSLLQGVRTNFENHWPQLNNDSDLDLFISPYADAQAVREVKELLKKHF